MSGRPLTPEEAALWHRLVATVEPLKAKHPAASGRANDGKFGSRNISDHCVSALKNKGPKNKNIVSKQRGQMAPAMASTHPVAAMPVTKEAFAHMLDQRRSARLHAERPIDRGFFTLETPPKSERTGNLDGHWERRLNKGQVAPDMTVDLHGHSLSSAYSRMDGALAQAQAAHMRVMLLITGKARAHSHNSANDGGHGTDGRPRGAIRRAMQDWLSASRHAGNIAAVRSAHPRHGGDGALYIILKRNR